MLGIAFKLLHLAGDFVDVGEQPAGGFAVEAGGGNERVVTLLAPRPRLRIELGPVVPALLGWKRREMTAARAGIERLAASTRYSVTMRAHPFIGRSTGVGFAHLFKQDFAILRCT